MESVRTAHILKLNKKKIRPDYDDWVYEKNNSTSTPLFSPSFKYYSLKLIRSSILAYNNEHPLHNNVFKYAFNKAKERTYTYYTEHAFQKRTRPLKDLFLNLKKIINRAGETYKISELRSNYYVNRDLEPKMMYALNDTTNLTTAPFPGLNDTDGFLDLSIYFTLAAWLPAFSGWKGHNKSNDESDFRPEIPADYIAKFLFNINCIRKTDIIRDLVPSFYIAPDPDVGKMPCFWLPDPYNFNHTTTTQFQLIKSLIPAEFKKSVDDFSICSGLTGFFFFYDSFLLPLRITFSIILQPFLCIFGQLGEPFFSIVRLIVMQPDKCTFDYFEIMPTILCSIVNFIAFGILITIFIIPFLVLCLGKCCEDFYKFDRSSDIELNKEKIENLESRVVENTENII
jgi:hypothetical protein